MRKRSSLILFVTILILAVSLVGFLPSSFSIIFDDFDDNATDPAKWITSVTGDKPTIAEKQSRLEIALPANSEDAPGQGYFGASYISVCQLQGDFDLQVEYWLLNWPAGNGVRVALSLDSNQSPPREYNAARVSFGNMDFPEEPREAYLYGGADTVNEIVTTGHLSGTLRIQRSAALLTGYYMDQESWVILDTILVTPANLHFGVSTWSHNYAFADQNVTVAFDNLTILQGEIMCPGVSTPTATHTLIATSAATQTITTTPTPTNTSAVHFVHLPLISQWPTPTPTATPAPTPIPTQTPTSTPTSGLPPILKNGDYEATLTDGVAGWIRFRITDNGATASNASFLMQRNLPGCYTVSYNFIGTKPIANGRFNFVVTDSVSILARLTCISESTTSASCSAYRPYPDGWLGLCGSADGLAVLQ